MCTAFTVTKARRRVAADWTAQADGLYGAQGCFGDAAEARPATGAGPPARPHRP